MRQIFFTKIKVHCWGGLGSQLFAWAIAEQIKIKFPLKEIQIVLHTNGVTKRDPEISFLSQRFVLIYKNDYVPLRDQSEKKHTKKIKFKTLVKYLLNKTCIVIGSSEPNSLAKVKPWTLELRDHYAHNTVPISIVNLIMKQISEYKFVYFDMHKNFQKCLGVHYRLGDLLHLNEKSFVQPDLLGKFLSAQIIHHNIRKISVYSDDLKVARKYLGPYLSESNEFIERDIWNTLAELSNQDFFIGTNSKISLWVTLFRKSQNLSAYVALPKSMEKELERILFDTCNLEDINFY